MDGLIARTRGIQPWRRVFHAMSGLAIVIGMWMLDLTRSEAVLILGSITGALLALDAARMLVPRVNELFFRMFYRLASPREATGLASSTWYAMGALVALAFFERRIAVSAILVLALADPLASYVGQRWGRRPLLGGTVEGTIVFLAVTTTILGLRHPAAVALACALLVTLVERRSWPLDDNFAVPIACAGALAAASML